MILFPYDCLCMFPISKNWFRIRYPAWLALQHLHNPWLLHHQILTRFNGIISLHLICIWVASSQTEDLDLQCTITIVGRHWVSFSVNTVSLSTGTTIMMNIKGGYGAYFGYREMHFLGLGHNGEQKVVNTTRLVILIYPEEEIIGRTKKGKVGIAIPMPVYH